jgi:signal transduction histidine kinase
MTQAPIPEGEIRARDDHRILVIDDEESNVRLLERLLVGVGFTTVRGVTDPREALTIVREWNPDVVLLDLLMPHVSGYDILDGLRELVPPGDYLPVLVLTADVTEAARRRALGAGAADFLTKPFDAVEVVLRTRNLLQTRDLHLQVQQHADRLEKLVEERTADLADALRDLRTSQETRRVLLARLVAAQEDERRRIAYDIHDDPVQVMVAAVLRLQMLRDKLPQGTEEAAMLSATEAGVHLALDRLRRMLFELHPSSLETGGLGDAISDYLDRTATDAGWTWHVDRALASEPELGLRTLLYRIAQEALVNVAKHANASSVTVEVKESERGFRLAIRDDGTGFDPEGSSVAADHLGLNAMRERAELAGGWLRIDSAPGEGTVVECWVPSHPAWGSGMIASADPPTRPPGRAPR